MLSPECLYWIALVALVLPSLAFNRMALVVLSSWAFGHFAHVFGPHEDPAFMFARTVAFGAALAFSQPWDGSRRAYANGVIAGLFVPSAVLAAYAAINFTVPPATMQEYHAQLAAYWAGWLIIMAQAILVPVGNDWEAVGRGIRRLDEWMLRQLVKKFGTNHDF